MGDLETWVSVPPWPVSSGGRAKLWQTLFRHRLLAIKLSEAAATANESGMLLERVEKEEDPEKDGELTSAFPGLKLRIQ